MNNSNQLNMFRAMISPIFKELDCVYSLWYNAPPMLPAGSPEAEAVITPVFRNIRLCAQLVV
jgi:hypothetical protein